MLDSKQQDFLLLVALYRRAERIGQAPGQDALLERNPELAGDLTHYFETGHFLGRCGCCWSGSSDEMSLRFEQMADAVDALPKESFRVTVLARLHDLPIEQVSARLGLPPKIVLRRGRDAADELRRTLDGGD